MYYTIAQYQYIGTTDYDFRQILIDIESTLIHFWMEHNSDKQRIKISPDELFKLYITHIPFSSLKTLGNSIFMSSIFTFIPRTQT